MSIACELRLAEFIARMNVGETKLAG